MESLRRSRRSDPRAPAVRSRWSSSPPSCRWCWPGYFVPDLLSHLGRTLALLVAAHVQVVFALLGGIAQNVVYHDLGPASATSRTAGFPTRGGL